MGKQDEKEVEVPGGELPSQGQEGLSSPPKVVEEGEGVQPAAKGRERGKYKQYEDS